MIWIVLGYLAIGAHEAYYDCKYSDYNSRQKQSVWIVNLVAWPLVRMFR